MRGNREGSKEERRGEMERGWGEVEKRKEGRMSRGNTY